MVKYVSQSLEMSIFLAGRKIYLVLSATFHVMKDIIFIVQVGDDKILCDKLSLCRKNFQ